MGIVVLGLFNCVVLHAETSLRVLPKEFNSNKENQMMRAWQRKLVNAALDTRLAELEKALQSKEGIQNYQQKRKAFLDKTFGPLPEKTLLNAKITNILKGDGFRVENIIFESLPGYHVTANLYVPSGEGPFPGVLLPCGHSANGKAYSAYQKMAILLAKNGFVVLCFDPVGQGERRQLIGDKPHKIYKHSEHNTLGVAPILLGKSLGFMMVWDGVRALDYLCSRPEVDSKRIGCTGNSGGGNLTSYLMAYDERIMAAAPGCFMTTHRRKNERPGPGDAEQNLFGQIKEGFDHPDFIITRAPKPTLILSATFDYVPIEGAWDAFRQAKRVYTQLGYPERVSLVETHSKHGLNQTMREATARFMSRWLQGKDQIITEKENVKTFTDEELQVTTDGQVGWLPQSRSIFDLYVSMEKDLALKRPTLTREFVREVTGIRPTSKLQKPRITKMGDGFPQKLRIEPEDGIVLPALLWPDGDKVPILLAPSKGFVSVVEQAQNFNSQGHPVLIVEVRDIGETQTRNWRFYGADFFIGQMLGRSWLAMRTEDLIIAARWFAETTRQNTIILHSSGEVGPAALHAGYLEPELIQKGEIKDSLESWKSLMNAKNASRQIHQAVHGALKYYDVPQLTKLTK